MSRSQISGHSRNTPLSGRDARSLVSSGEGVAAVEFAMIAPTFLVLLMGGLNLAQMAYGQALLNGAVQETARSATLETANTAALDAKVSALVGRVLVGATVRTTRQNYYDFSDIGRPERWNDRDANGNCDPGESYTDENRNGSWDRDVGRGGNGGANDVVLYSVTATYKPIFPMPLPDSVWSRQTTLKSVTVRKNQPFSGQARYATVAATC